MEGLALAWDLGLKRIMLEFDSHVSIGLIQRFHSNSDSLLVQKIKVMLERNWEVMINHIPREANRIADV